MDFNTGIVIFGVLVGALGGIGFGAARRAVILDVLFAQAVLFLGSMVLTVQEMLAMTGEYPSGYIESAPETFMALNRLGELIESKSYWLALASMFAALIPAQILGLWLFPKARQPFNLRTVRGAYHVIFRVSLILFCGMISAAIAAMHLMSLSEIAPHLPALADASPDGKAAILEHILPSDHLFREADGYRASMFILPPLLYWFGVLCLWFLALLARSAWNGRKEIASGANRGVEASVRTALRGSSGLQSSFEAVRGWGAERLRNAQRQGTRHDGVE